MTLSIVPRRAGVMGILLVFLFTIVLFVFPLQRIPVPYGEQGEVVLAAGQSVPARQGYVVELEGPPAAQVYAAARTQADVAADVTAAAIAETTQVHLATLEQAQQTLLAELATMDVQILYRTQRVYNGIALRGSPDQMDQIRRLPGVKAVHMLLAKYPARQKSVPYLGVPEVWAGESKTGVTGKGMRIAIIDTGIDYLHRDFSGPGTGYERNDPAVIGEVSGFPGSRVVGGYDFAGDTYNADARDVDYEPIPQPDPDPMDCYGLGHGTHVAGVAAGSGVLRDGMTYMGPYNDSLNHDDFLLGPGVAPQAEIYALKIFGCGGSSELVNLAIEWAVDPDQDGDFSDGVDVINMSLGSTYGALYDPSTVASDNAAAIGVIVVTSAGNAGDTYYSMGSPAVSGGAISVAASDSVGQTTCNDSFCRDTVPDFSSRGPRRIDSFLKPDLAAPGRSILSAGARLGTSGYSSSGTSMSSPHVAGIMLLLRQYYPDLGFDAANVARTGWTVSDLKALAMNTAIPELRTGGVEAGLQYGPARVGSGRIAIQNALQSEVIAYNGNAPELVSLSFGAPDVLESYRAVQMVRVENKGEMTVTMTVSYTGITDMPGVAFSLWEDDEDRPGDEDVLSDANNDAASKEPFEITVAPHGSVSFPLTMKAQAEEMARARDGTVSDTQIFPRHRLSSESGYLVFSRTDGGLTLHLPVYAAPRAVARMEAAVGSLDFGQAKDGVRVVELVGHDLVGTVVPTDVISLVSFFGLQYRSPHNEPAYGGDGQIDLTDHADLRYVGIASDEVATENPQIYFGIATHQAWSTPNEVQFDIYIDTDGDGKSDYRLFNSDQVGYRSDTQVSDAFVSVLEDLATGVLTSQVFLNGYSAAAADSYLYNSNVMVLPVSMESLDIHAERSRFRYFVESYSGDVSNGIAQGQYVERTPVFFYDVAKPALRMEGSSGVPPLFDARAEESFTVWFDQRAYARAAMQGLLLFHHHNDRDQRTQTISIDYDSSSIRYLPFIRAD